MRTLFLAATVFSLSACSLFGIGDDDGSFEDVYSYTASDEDGEAVVTGLLYVEYVPNDVIGEPDLLRGRWELQAEGAVGPQDGEGTLRGTAEMGTVEGDLFSIDLNPGISDDNVFLSGRFENERARMTGTWSHSTLIGPVAGGTFEAVRIEEASRTHVAG